MANKPVVEIGVAADFDEVPSMSTSPYKLAFFERGVNVRWPDGEIGEVFGETDRRVSCPLAWHPDNVTLYYSHEQVYAINTETCEATPVTSFEEDDQFGVHWTLTCSPDGDELVYIHSRRVAPRLAMSGNTRAPASSVCRIGTDGTGFQLLLEGEGDELRLWMADVQWSTRTLYASMIQSPRWCYRVVGLDAGEPDRLIPLQRNARAGRPAFHPTDAQILYTNRSMAGLSLLSLDTEEYTKLLDFGCVPSWSPDGQQIAFMNDHYELWLYDLPSQSAQRLVWMEGRRFSVMTRGGYSCTSRPVWSPDGRYLCFGLTKDRRLRNSSNTERYRSLLAQMEAAEDAQTRERHCTSMRRLFWAREHRVGIIDFQEQHVWVQEDYWSDQAWSPG